MNMGAPRHRGRAWVILDKNGRLIEDIDTDQIYHNAHLHITEVSQMGSFALGNLEGWKDFPQRARPGDIILAGRNFGAGSSRQQAVDCFISLGIGAIIAPSFSSIYFRNAVNSGFPVLSMAGIGDLAGRGEVKSGDELSLDFLSGEGLNLTRNIPFHTNPMAAVQLEILRAGNLFEYAKKRSGSSS